MAYYLNSELGAEPVTREDQVRLAALDLAIGSRGRDDPSTAEIVTRAEAFRAFLAGEPSADEIRKLVVTGAMSVNQANDLLLRVDGAQVGEAQARLAETLAPLGETQVGDL